MSVPAQQSLPAAASPLTKIVFIKKICGFAAKNPLVACKLTKGINRNFEEAMIDFGGFAEFLINRSLDPSSTYELGALEYDVEWYHLLRHRSAHVHAWLQKYSKRGKNNDVPFLYRLLHRDSVARWMLVEFTKVPDHVPCSIPLSKLADPSRRQCKEMTIFVKSLFRGRDADEIIEVIGSLQKTGVLLPLSSPPSADCHVGEIRLGLSQATLLIHAVRDSTHLFQRESEQHMQLRYRKLLSFLIRECKCHPFREVDSNGFNAFHVAARNHGAHRPWILRLLVEIGMEEFAAGQLLRARVKAREARKNKLGFDDDDDDDVEGGERGESDWTKSSRTTLVSVLDMNKDDDAEVWNVKKGFVTARRTSPNRVGRNTKSFDTALCIVIRQLKVLRPHLHLTLSEGVSFLLYHSDNDIWTCQFTPGQVEFARNLFDRMGIKIKFLN